MSRAERKRRRRMREALERLAREGTYTHVGAAWTTATGAQILKDLEETIALFRSKGWIEDEGAFALAGSVQTLDDFAVPADPATRADLIRWYTYI